VIAAQKFTDVPPAMLPVLLRFNQVKVMSAYLIPFADPRRRWMHETSWHQLLTGTDEASEAEIGGKTLTVTTAPFKSPRDNKMVTVVTTWERIE
jgi:hypothetical protein